MRCANITGLILAGGSSRRLGRDKATCQWQGMRIIDHVAAALATVTTRIFIGVGDDRTDYRVAGTIHVVDPMPDAGPLAGIYAGLTAMKTPWLLVLACDVPRITPSLLGRIIEQTMYPVSAVISVEPGGRVHPLCAAYHESTLPLVEMHLRQRILSLRSLVNALSDTRYVRVAEEYLVNINTPEDLAALDT